MAKEKVIMTLSGVVNGM